MVVLTDEQRDELRAINVTKRAAAQLRAACRLHVDELALRDEIAASAGLGRCDRRSESIEQARMEEDATNGDDEVHHEDFAKAGWWGNSLVRVGNTGGGKASSSNG